MGSVDTWVEVQVEAGTCPYQQRAVADDDDEEEQEVGDTADVAAAAAAAAAAGFLEARSHRTDAHTREVTYVTHPESLSEQTCVCVVACS